jgi:hypothetical protein
MCTLGDLDRLKLDYKSVQTIPARQADPPVIDGFTADQRFFLAFARTRGLATPAPKKCVDF